MEKITSKIPQRWCLNQEKRGTGIPLVHITLNLINNSRVHSSEGVTVDFRQSGFWM